MFKLVFFLATCILACHSVEVTNGSTSYDLTDEKFFNLEENSQRKGFDIFIRLSNLFIDRTFIPNLKLSDIMNASELIPSGGPYTEYVSIPHRYYPSLFYFLVSVLLLAFLIPIFGFIFCSYRCCCNKIDLHDRKGDSFKRKTYTFFLFAILMAILICSIVLFFTNMNAATSFKNTTIVVHEVMTDLDKFNANEMPVFFQAIVKNTDFSGNSTSNLIQDTLTKFLKQYFDTVSRSSFFKNLNETIFSINELVNATGNQAMIDAAAKMDINEQLDTVKATIMDKLDNMPDLTHLSDTIKQETDVIKAIVDDLVSEINPNTTEAQNITEQLKPFYKYYDAFYFTLMAVNVAVLFLFFLYSIGTVGICNRRSNPKRRKCCDRTTHAKLLLSGVGFFVLFSFLILIVAIALLVPGILFRQVVCAPVIEIENNKLYTMFKPELEQVALDQLKFLPDSVNKTDLIHKLASIKLATVLRECDQFARSDEMERFISDLLKDGQNLLPLDEFLSLLPGQNQLTDKFISPFVDALKKLEQDVALLVISDPKPIYMDIKNQVDVLIGSLENQLVSDKQSEDFKKLVTELDNLKTKSMTETISSFLNTTVNNIFRDMPSCRGISDIYKKIVTNVCFEYLDNLNAYWFFLIIIVLLNILITLFAVKQSNLFRKYLAYNVMSENHSPYKEKYLEPTTAIDAYEMNDYHKFNYNYKNKQQDEKVIFKRTGAAGNSPPPKYF